MSCNQVKSNNFGSDGNFRSKNMRSRQRQDSIPLGMGVRSGSRALSVAVMSGPITLDLAAQHDLAAFGIKNIKDNAF